MRTPSFALQEAYFNALDGQITIDGAVVPVYDVVPEGADYPYIVLADQIVRERNDKNTFGTDIIMQLDIVTGFEGAYGGKKQMYNITDAVINIIRTRSAGYFNLPGFNVYRTSLDLASFIQDETDSHILYINRIRFRHFIEEL